MRELERIAAVNLPRSRDDILGTLQWTDAGTGKVKKWVVRIGDRSDRVTVEAPGGQATRSHGWTWVFNRLRRWMVSGI